MVFVPIFFAAVFILWALCSCAILTLRGTYRGEYQKVCYVILSLRFILFFYGLMILGTSILIYLKIRNVINSYQLTFTPLIIANVITTIYSLLFIVFDASSVWTQKTDFQHSAGRDVAIFVFVHSFSFTFFTAFLALRLDSVIDWNWGPIFLPLFASHVLSIIRSCWRIGDVTDIHFFKCGQFVSTVLLIIFEIMLCIALNLHEHNQLETNYLIITLVPSVLLTCCLPCTIYCIYHDCCAYARRGMRGSGYRTETYVPWQTHTVV